MWCFFILFFNFMFQKTYFGVTCTKNYSGDMNTWPRPSSLSRQCSHVTVQSVFTLKLRISNLSKIRSWPTLTLTWKPLSFLSHIKCRTNDDRFPLSLWEVWFCSSLGVTIPALIGPPQQCGCNDFHHDSYGDHLQTCQTKLEDSQVHDWVVYKLGVLLGSVGHWQRLLLVLWSWTSRWPILGLGDQICYSIGGCSGVYITLLDNLLTQVVQMVFLIPAMVNYLNRPDPTAQLGPNFTSYN